MFDMIIMALQFYVQWLYFEYVMFVLEHWNTSAASFNAGQVTILVEYIIPALETWTGEVKEEWPYTDPEQYAGEMWEAYDFEVMDRAFSMTITEPMDTMWQIVNKAQAAQEWVMILEAMEWSQM